MVLILLAGLKKFIESNSILLKIDVKFRMSSCHYITDISKSMKVN